MADAEDLKSSGDFSSCGFDSHPGHQCFLLKLDELQDRRLPCTSDVPHLEKVRVAPGSRHAPDRRPSGEHALQAELRSAEAAAPLIEP